MIGRGAAVAALGPRRREVHGPVAFAAWMGVHAILITGARDRRRALVDWAWANFARTRGPQLLDRPEAAAIDWSEREPPEQPSADAAHVETATAG
jgi:NADH dehydrogenase